MAITFDAGLYGGFVSASSQTTAFTMGSGTGGYLVVGVLGDATNDLVTGVTWNGTSMTLVDKQNSAPGSVFWQYLYVLAGPATGTQNVVVSASGTVNYIQTYIASYLGVKATGQPEAAAENAGTGDPFTTSLTTATANAWTVALVNASVGLVVSGAFTLRASDTSPIFTSALGDSNGPIVAAGSTSLVVSGAGGQKQSEMIALAPLVGSSPSASPSPSASKSPSASLSPSPSSSTSSSASPSSAPSVRIRSSGCF